MRHKRALLRYVSLLSFFLILKLCSTQFHQDDYEIVQERLTVYNYNKSRIRNPEACVYKYNDTMEMKAINLSGFFLEEVSEVAMVHFLLYKFVADDYRAFPMNVSLDICEEYKKLGQRNPFGIKTAIELSNFRGCPFLKNKQYHLYNWFLEQEKFPPHLPPGKYSLRIVCYVDDNSFLFDGAWFGELVAKAGGKKKRRRQG